MDLLKVTVAPTVNIIDFFLRFLTEKFLATFCMQMTLQRVMFSPKVALIKLRHMHIKGLSVEG
jgi:hypothetical protein